MVTSTEGASPDGAKRIGIKEAGSAVEATSRASIWMTGVWGVITAFTGVPDLHEQAAVPDLELETDRESVEESVERVLVSVPGLGFDA